MQRHRFLSLALLIAAAAPPASVAAQSRDSLARARMEDIMLQRAMEDDLRARAYAKVSERTYKLVHLNPSDAAKLIGPYVNSYPGISGVYDAGSMRAITVRETPPILARIEALLKEHDRAPVTIVLRFQLIAAESTQTRDPAIAAVESQLRNLFRFPGYRLLSEATATAGTNEGFNLLIPAGEEHLQLGGSIVSVNSGEGEPSVHLRVSLERPAPVIDPKTGSVMAGGLLGTGLTVPIGQTVVMGSTTPGGKIMALILVVRPEIAAPRK
jgi:hypothetical protein